MKFFFDNNLSESLVKGLREFGEDVIHLKELFDENTEDILWLKHLGQERMVLITKDERIRRNPFELKALRDNKVGAFFLGGKKQGRCQIIQQIVRNWPRIKEKSINTRPPFAFRIPPIGTKFDKIEI
jgi:hypothetical protein